MQEKTIKIWNLDVNYKIFGDEKNQVFLILHWWWGSSDSWIKVAELLSKDFFVVIPDLPGFGKTALDKVYTLEEYANFVNNFLEKLKIKEVILLWHSNWWAIAISLVWKIKIKKLILNNSAWIRKKIKTSLKRKILWFFVKPLKFIRHIPWWEKFRELFYKFIGSRDYLEAEKNPYKKQTYLNMINTDLQDKIKTIKEDTLLIRWKYDTYTPLEDGKKMNDLIENSKLEIIDSTHWIHLKQPEKLVEIIKEYFKNW